MLWIARILSMHLIIFLTACTTVAPTSAPTQVSWNERQTTLSHLKNWQLSGKIGIQTAQDGGSASIDWTQNHGVYSISLTGPLGAGGIKLYGHPGNVSMETADGAHQTASSPEELLAKTWGWNLPVSNLSYWVRGLAVPSIPASTHFDSYNRLSELTQQGWDVQYMSYTSVNGIELPSKISITSPTLKTKIIIHQWKLNTF